MLRQLSWANRVVVLEAIVCLGLASLALRALPFHRLSPFLGQHMAESSADDASGHHARVRRIGLVVRATGRRMPWRCLCLEQGLAAKLMLRRRGLSNTLYLGAARTEAGVQAHAWVRSGSLILVGAEGRERFAVVSTFADGERSR